MNYAKFFTALTWVGVHLPAAAQPANKSLSPAIDQSVAQSAVQNLSQNTDQKNTQAVDQATLAFDAITIEGQAHVESTPWQSNTSRQELDALQINNWNDFGRRAEPGIMFNESSQSINVRGLDKNRVLTRIDGIRQTWLNDEEADAYVPTQVSYEQNSVVQL
jgi:hypothetical protein